MNKDTIMMQTIDKILFHSKCLDILRRPDVPYAQAKAMILELERQYLVESKDYYERDDETFEVEERSDEQELIDDDNRERAADMNAVSRSPF